MFDRLDTPGDGRVDYSWEVPYGSRAGEYATLTCQDGQTVVVTSRAAGSYSGTFDSDRIDINATDYLTRDA